jgi:hypothetical protein
MSDRKQWFNSFKENYGDHEDEQKTLERRKVIKGKNIPINKT